jgi:hypothetical protein
MRGVEHEVPQLRAAHQPPFRAGSISWVARRLTTNSKLETVFPTRGRVVATEPEAANDGAKNDEANSKGARNDE